jgi:hypothetical protein
MYHFSQHQLYADDLGPAEEVESDRQQRVYRGQPSTVGQVARDRDGLRHQVTNAIPVSTKKFLVTESDPEIWWRSGIHTKEENFRISSQVSSILI